jgi:hypothetical protein
MRRFGGFRYALSVALVVGCGPAETGPIRNSFCGIPSSSCGKRLVDEKGVTHTVVCTPEVVLVHLRP